MSPRRLRLAALAVPACVVALIAIPAHDAHLRIVGTVLLGLWFIMACVVGAGVGVPPDPRRATVASFWERADVLTGTGAAMLWTGAGALVAARVAGWASLSIIGVLGIGIVYLTVIWTSLISSDLLVRRARITRAILPELCVEGEPLREEVRLANLKIPVGMRMFATGRAQRHGVISRYVVDTRASGTELVLGSELGPARRGEHRAPPLGLWLGDIFGLTRTLTVHRGEASFVVVPRGCAVDHVRDLLGPGGDAPVALPHQLPSEGTFRIREYAPGDDTRRIHWVRSLQQQELVVRLPDEIPPAEAEVRLILDTDLSGVELLTCRAPDDLLDALVRVWLGIGKALAANGTRVTLVTAAIKAGVATVVERPLVARSSRDGARLGASVSWQADIRLAALLGKRKVKQVIISSRPRRMSSNDELTWVVVPEIAWTSPELALPDEPRWTLPFPSGSADNRSERRKRERARVEEMWNDRALFTGIVCWTDWATFSGDYYARPHEVAGRDRVALAVIP